MVVRLSTAQPKLAQLTTAIGLTAFVLTCGAIWAYYANTYRPPNRPLRIAAWNGPPFETVYPDGSVGGLGPDVIKAAAARLGIRLTWVTPKEGPEVLLPTGRVDLWAVMSVTPERQALFFLTSPWADSNYGLVSLESHQDEPVKVVGSINAPLQLRRARTTWPNADVRPYEDHVQLYEALCRGELKHILMNQRWLMASSMSRTPACSGASFAVTMLPHARQEIATGAAPGQEVHALALRDEIDRMALDGSLNSIIGRYPIGLGSMDWMRRFMTSGCWISSVKIG